MMCPSPSMAVRICRWYLVLQNIVIITHYCTLGAIITPYFQYWEMNTFSKVYTVHFIFWHHGKSCSVIHAFHCLVRYIRWAKSYLQRQYTGVITTPYHIKLSDSQMWGTYIAQHLQQFVYSCLWKIMLGSKWINLILRPGYMFSLAFQPYTVSIRLNSRILDTVRHYIMVSDVADEVEGRWC